MVVTLFHVLLKVLAEVHERFLHLAVELWRKAERVGSAPLGQGGSETLL